MTPAEMASATSISAVVIVVHGVWYDRRTRRESVQDRSARVLREINEGK